MTKDIAIKILLNEKECVQRADKNNCNRDCAQCNLVMESNDILSAYDFIIDFLKNL